MNQSKKVIQNVIVTILIISMAFSYSFAVSAKETILTEGEFRYKIVNDAKGNHSVSIQEYIGVSQEITIPETLGGYTVTEVSALKKEKTYIKTLVITKNIKSINPEIYKEKIESYKVVSENRNFSTAEGVLFNKTKTELVSYPKEKKDKEYTEPITVKTSSGANGNPYVEKWTFSSNKKYKKIEDYACYGLSGLKEVVIPNNVKIIGDFSFAQCKQLKKVKLGKGIERIWNNSFENTNIQRIKLPQSLLSIGIGAFRACKLESLKLPSRLKFIDSYAFAQNAKLKKVKVPDSVTLIRKDVFGTKKKGMKVEMPSYLKKTYRFNGLNYNYIAKATVFSNGKTKDYKAEKITKIKPFKKSVFVKKGKTERIYTNVYINKKKKGILKTNILKFSSSNKKVVKVTSSGKVKALRKGTSIVTVTLRTADESYSTKKILGNHGEILVDADKMTKKSYKIKITVK